MAAEKKIEMGAWGLFLLSALFYSASNLMNGQTISLLGSLAFLLACIVFIFLRLQQRD